MFYLFGVSLSLFLCFILLSKSGKTFADKVLTVWLFVIGLHIFSYYLIYTGFWIEHPNVLGINVPFPLLHGPLLYIYTAALTAQLPTKRWMLLLHFLTIVFILVLIIPVLSMSPAEKKGLIIGNISGFETTIAIIDIADNLSGVVYFVWSLLLLRKHRRNILNQFSFTDKINLRWLQYLIYGVGLIWVAVFIGNTNIIYGLAVLFVFFIGYYGIKQVG
ncbi:MAG: helix-turn-helix domain-containing protein, partial [Bacteroidia bacterium]